MCAHVFLCFPPKTFRNTCISARMQVLKRLESRVSPSVLRPLGLAEGLVQVRQKKKHVHVHVNT